MASNFLRLVVTRLAEIDIELAAIVTDNGPEFTGAAFTDVAGRAGH